MRSYSVSARFRGPLLARFLLGCLGLLLLLTRGPGRPALAADADDVLADPVPLRRVLIPPERLQAELERAKQGILDQLPRADFEARVKRAQQAGEALKNPPRLIEARYSATLLDAALLGTLGQWRIVNPGAGAGVLPLGALNLALHKVHVHKNGVRPAILGDLDGKNLGLLLEESGEHTVDFGWTARGAPVPGGLRFDLRLPACAVSTLELRLPADRVVVGREAFLLTGPLPAEKADRRLWRLDCAGRTQIDLVIRKASSGNGGPLVLAQLQSRQEIEPDLVRADFDFELEVSGPSVRDLTFDCDPGLQPFEVNVRNLESWQLRAAANPGQPATLIVRLREPFQDGSLQVQVRCLAPLDADKNWSCPGMRLQGALPRGETLVLRIPPEVRLENWQAGSFFLTNSGVAEPAAPGARPKSTDSSQVQVLHLTGTGLPPASGRSRPSARVRTPPPDLQARQLAWWHIGAGTSTYAAQITYDVEQGQIFRLPLALPAGWEVDRLELAPADLLRNWAVAREGGRPVLSVELQRPLLPASGRPASPTPRLSVWLRPQLPIPTTGATLPFPDLVPLGAPREGVLAISIDPVFQVKVNATVAAAVSEERGPWGNHPPDFFYPYRGLPVAGSVQLQPRRTEVRARCTSEVLLAAERAAIVTHLLLQPKVGNPEVIDVAISAPVAGKWDWKTERGVNQVRSAQRLPAGELATRLGLLGLGNPLGVTGLLAAPPHLELWRLTLTRPLREPLLLQSTLTFPGFERAKNTGTIRWEVPLPTVLAADPMEGEVTVHLAGVEVSQFEARGLWEAAEGTLRPGPASWRTFRHGQAIASLALNGQRSLADPGARAALDPFVDRAHLTTHVSPEGRLLHHYRFQVWNWRQRLFPLRLPGESRCLAAKSDGRWIADLAPGAVDGETVVELPVTAGAGPHALEVVYAVNAPPWKFWATIDAPAPTLPVRTLAFRRTWRLPPGTTPLFRERFDRLPGPDEQPATAWSRLGSWQDLRLSYDQDDWQDQQRNVMVQASAALEPPESEDTPWTLGASLDQLFDHLRGKTTVVVDATALRALGVAPTTPLTLDPLAAEDSERVLEPVRALYEPWEELGLVYVPCRPAALLTSHGQLESWRRAASQDISPSIETAVAEAVRHGHDRSGRFFTLAGWLRLSSPAFSVARESGFDVDSLPYGLHWTEWEPLAGVDKEGRLFVVRHDVLTTGGLLLAALVGVMVWQARRSRRWLRGGLLLSCLAAAGLALLWLPETLHVLAWYGAAAAGLAAVCGSLESRLARRIAPAAAALLVVVVGHGPGSLGQVPTPVTVYVVPAKDPNQQTVLAPPALLQQLDALAARGVAGLRQPVLLSAQYKGTVGAASADFWAEFQAHSFTDEATLALPLAGVELKEALCDGATADLRPNPQREGYLIKMKGKGTRVLRLNFSVAVAGSDERSLRCTIPELIQSRLALDFPPGARYLYAVAIRGSQTVTPERAAADKPQHLEAELGRMNNLSIRWRQEERAAPPTSVQVREAYLWNLSASSSSLFAVLQYTVKQGAAATLVLDLPEQLEVRSVEASRLPNAGADEVLPRLKDWQILGRGNSRRLLFEFQRPLISGVQLTLELVPRAPFGTGILLPLPTPLEARTTEGFLAYRIDGLRAQVAEHLRINRMDPKTFLQEWRTAGMSDPGPQTHAYTFLRGAGGSPFLRLQLLPPGGGTTCTQQVSWVVGPRQAALTANLRLEAPGRELLLVEWDVPPSINDLDLSGTDVRYWSRSGARLQIWLQRAVSSVELRLTGWQSLVEIKDKKSRTPTFRLAPLRVLTTQTQSTSVNVSAVAGLALEPEGLKNLGPVPETRPSDRDHRFVTERPDFSGVFQVRPALASADVRILSFAEFVERGLSFNASLDFQVREGELRTLTVRLRNWVGDDIHFEAAGGIARREPGRDGAGRTWTLTLADGARARFRLKIAGRMPLDTATGAAMPDVSVDGAASQERWVAVAGRELRAEDPRGLSPVSEVAQTLQPWPAEAERVRRAGAAWKVQTNDWHLRLLPRSPAVEAAPFRVFLAEQSAEVIDGNRWLHQATYRLYHETGSDLGIVLPAKATLLALSVDGSGVVQIQPRPDRVWLPLSGFGGVRGVRLSWIYPPGVESLQRPNLEQPVLEGVTTGPTLWTVLVPVGYRVDTAKAVGTEDTAAGQALRRADTQVQLSAVLAARASASVGGTFAAQLLTSQERFYRNVRQVELHLAAPISPERLKELKDQNLRLAHAHDFEEVRSQAEQRAHTYTQPLDAATGFEPSAGPTRVTTRGLLLTERGFPTYWLVTDDAQAPIVPLVAAESSATRRTREATAILLVVLLAIGGLSFFWRPRAPLPAKPPETPLPPPSTPSA